MNKEMIKMLSNITIQEIKPRSQKTGKPYPSPEFVAEIVKSRYAGLITHYQVRQILDTYYEYN